MKTKPDCPFCGDRCDCLEDWTCPHCNHTYPAIDPKARIRRTDFDKSLTLNTVLKDGSKILVSLDEEQATCIITVWGKTFYEVPYESDGVNISFDFEETHLPKALLALLP